MMPIYDSTSDPCAQESSLSISKDLNPLNSLNRKLQKLRALCCDLSRDEFPKGVFMVVCFCFQTNNDTKGQEEGFSFYSEMFNFHVFSFEYLGLAIARAKPFQCPDVLELKQASQSFIPTVNIYQGLLEWASW